MSDSEKNCIIFFVTIIWIIIITAYEYHGRYYLRKKDSYKYGNHSVYKTSTVSYRTQIHKSTLMTKFSSPETSLSLSSCTWQHLSLETHDFSAGEARVMDSLDGLAMEVRRVKISDWSDVSGHRRRLSVWDDFLFYSQNYYQLTRTYEGFLRRDPHVYRMYNKTTQILSARVPGGDITDATSFFFLIQFMEFLSSLDHHAWRERMSDNKNPQKHVGPSMLTLQWTCYLTTPYLYPSMLHTRWRKNSDIGHAAISLKDKEIMLDVHSLLFHITKYFFFTKAESRRVIPVSKCQSASWNMHQ